MNAVGSKSTGELPDDVDALKAIIAKQAEQIAVLEHNVEVFRRLAFGKSTEKRPPSSERREDPNQGHLFYAELLEEAQRTAKRLDTEGTIEAKSPGDPKKKGGRRKKFPSHAPVLRTTYELKGKDLVCECGGELHAIGEDVRRELERFETTIVHEIALKKYGCRSCESGVKTTPGPDRVISKGILGKGFLAHVLVERFQNHMPYHRLEKKYASEGLDLNRSVLQRSMARLAELFEPIHEQLRKDVLSSPAIHTDDTPVTIAQGSQGKSRQGRTWVYLDLEGRHYYDFTESRSRDGPMKILEGYEGFIHADAYPGYDQVYLPGGAREVACWAHARRKFVQAEGTDPELARAALERIGKLYVIERSAREMDADARRAFREEKARPLLEELFAWLEVQQAGVLPKSPMATAIGYALNQREALMRYLEDGRLAIDNNTAERGLRPFAVGRKNWLFFQQDTGGRTAAVLASLLQTAKAIGLNPRNYFRDIMTRISTCSDVSKLTPHGWREHFADEAAANQERALELILQSTE